MSEGTDPETKKALEFIRLQIHFAQALAEDEAEDEMVKEYRRVEMLLMRSLWVEAERDSYRKMATDTANDMAQRAARAEMKLKGEKQ